ncbi:MAG: hypothetical protein HUK15_08395, partial [Bacteroidales bacterium]|nr:hypothetical protein [Bacteroidales bacterium]
MKRTYILILLALLAFQSCKHPDPSEDIPSFVRVDEAFVDITDPLQGTAKHGITDCWLSVNGKTIGIFEIPFEVPVLAHGKAHIEIDPGIKNSGRDADRMVYSMMTNCFIDTILTQEQVTVLKPHYSYRQGVEFVMVENFDNIGSKFEKADSCEYGFTIVNEGAEEGNSMYF